MLPRIIVLPLIVGMVALLSAGKDRPSFHGVHEGEEQSSKLPYEFMYAEATPLSASDEGQALLEGCFAAYGGRGHLAALNSVCLTHDIVSAMFGEGQSQRTITGDRQYRIERSGEVRTLDGSNAWHQGKKGTAELKEDRYRGELFSYLTMRLPQITEIENFSEPRYAKRGEDPLGYIFFDKPDSLLLVVGIDPETHLIRSSEGIIRSGERTTVYINHFDEHEEFDGYVFPTLLTNISMGIEVAKSRLVNVDVNCGTTAADFDLDGAGARSEGR